MENGGEAKEVDWDEVKTIFKGLDKDGDRSVEWEEFFVRIFLHNESNWQLALPKDVVSSKAKDQHWRSLMEKSTKRDKNHKFSEENVKEIFHTIDKDDSGEITMKVI